VVHEPPMRFFISSGPSLMGENSMGKSDIVSPFFLFPLFCPSL
jgi:hypothetical protein